MLLFLSTIGWCRTNGNVVFSKKQFFSVQSCFAIVILEASNGSEKCSVDPVFSMVSHKACLIARCIPHFSDIKIFPVLNYLGTSGLHCIFDFKLSPRFECCMFSSG
jgi:hypothetical protein